ncbi:phage distal tail protein [Streptomyces gilvosporeus]|uniref:Siphovirus-type tail component C-terminal domain-containing protein n=2 Tax=Actinomycetes TaxID=1760 RepID=A0A1V0TSR9_9ACTN|nr:phage tail domain-containing protein [Streptomyces gilvosporeus]ARF56005.1 hypothetical protein B1H19_19050 [Streptomyces gilvosporeus]
MDRTTIDVAGMAEGMVPGQIRYGELLLGAGTPYQWRKLKGWETLPPQDSGNVPRSGDHGAHLGRLLAQTRTIGLDEVIVRAEAYRFGAVVEALNDGTPLAIDEQPLLVHLDDRGPLLAWARVTNRDVPVEPAYAIGTVTGAALEWEATDPRRYTPAVQHAETGLPEPCLPWHTHPDTGRPRGVPASTGNVTAYNLGKAPTHPVVIFRGPVDTPALINRTTGRRLEYRVALEPGEQLTVDTFAGTATLPDGESLLTDASLASWPEQTFTLDPGDNELEFRAAPSVPADPRAAVALRWRSAHW